MPCGSTCSRWASTRCPTTSCTSCAASCSPACPAPAPRRRRRRRHLRPPRARSRPRAGTRQTRANGSIATRLATALMLRLRAGAPVARKLRHARCFAGRKTSTEVTSELSANPRARTAQRQRRDHQVRRQPRCKRPPSATNALLQHPGRHSGAGARGRMAPRTARTALQTPRARLARDSATKRV